MTLSTLARSTPLSPVLTRSLAAAVGAGVGATVWATLIERNWYALRHFDMPVLAPGSKPLRILHVSDLHIVPRQEHRIQWVRELAKLHPDFVINTGDNLSDRDGIPAALRAMEPLLEFPGAFVFGSNDYFYPKLKNPLRYFNDSHAKGKHMSVGEFDVRPLRDGFTDGGWIDLTHHRTRVDVAGVALEFVGVDDPHLEYDNYAQVSAPAASRRGETAATLGVVHAPYTRVLDAMAKDGADAIIAGHTHGGQIAVPFYGALVTNCDLDTSRVKGVSRWWPGASGNDSTLREETLTTSKRRNTALPSPQAPQDAAWLHVSAGLGHNKYTPIRFACRPEASLLTLTARAQ